MLWAQKASAIIRETKGGRPTIQRYVPFSSSFVVSLANFRRAGPLDDGPSTRRGRPTIQRYVAISSRTISVANSYRAGPLFGWV